MVLAGQHEGMKVIDFTMNFRGTPPDKLGPKHEARSDGPHKFYNADLVAWKVAAQADREYFENVVRVCFHLSIHETIYDFFDCLPNIIRF